MDDIIKPNSIYLKIGLWACWLTIVISPFVYWFQTLGDISIYFQYEIPAGQTYYVFSKLAGMYALMLVWLQIVLALLKHSIFGQYLNFWTVGFHRKLGTSAALCVVLHAGLFVAAVSLRQAHFDYGLLLPNFNHGFYALTITLGVLALYLIFAVIITGILRHYKFACLNWIHRFAIVAFILAFIHSLLIGTETRFNVMTFSYIVMGNILLFALWARFYKPFIASQTQSS